MKSARAFAAVTAALVLASCGGSDEPPIDPSAVHGARAAVLPSLQLLLEGGLNPARVRPGALLGAYMGYHLIQAKPGVLGAIQGIDAQMALAFGQERPEQADALFAVLEELGARLQSDITDMLNRSSDRRAALDEYIRDLRQNVERANDQKTILEERIESIGNDRSEQRQVVQDLQREVNRALREKEFSIAGGRQEELTTAESALAELEARQERAEDLLDIYEELLEVAGERIDAMTQNREVLIAGLKVVNVPGIDELGILEEGGRRGRRRSFSL